jgi:hypothetical protein
MTNLIDSVRQYLLDNAGITSLVSTRIYPDFLPQGNRGQVTDTLPSIVYKLISDVPFYDSPTGDSGAASARIQFDCIANTNQQANDIELAIRQAMSGYRGYFGSMKVMSAFKANTLSQPMRDVQLSRTIADYIIQYQVDFQSVLC